MRHHRRFRVSSFCSANGCLGVDIRDDQVEITDTANDCAHSLVVTREEWAAFVAGVKAGEFDLD